MNATMNGKGVTTDSYADNALVFTIQRRYFKSFSIINTDSANDLKFKFTGYVSKNELSSKTLKGETTLPHTTDNDYNLILSDVGYHHIKLEVKSDVSVTPTDFAYEVFLN